MQIPTRILRAEACDLDPSLRDLTIAQEEQRDRIMAIAQNLMVRHGPHTITFTSFATALKIGSNTLRRYFCDLDELLAAILTNHLTAISRAIGDAVRDAPELDAAGLPSIRRAAYMRATRAPYGGFTPAHFLFTKYHHLLPPDLLEPLQAVHDNMGFGLCPERPQEALALLDMPAFTPPEIEAALAAILRTPPMFATAAQAVYPEAQPDTGPEPADPNAPVVMCSRHENAFGPKHPDDVYILRPTGRPSATLLHAPPKE